MAVIAIIISAIIAAFSWLLILGGSMGKSDLERYLEDEEQMKYLQDWAEKKKRKKQENKKISTVPH